MWILPLVGYLGIALGFAFLTLAIGTLSVKLRLLRFTDLSCSFRTLLPVRIGRGAYCIRKASPNSTHIQRNSAANPPLRRGQVSSQALPPQYRFACRLLGEYAQVPHREVERSVIYYILQYVIVLLSSCNSRKHPWRRERTS